MIMYKPITIVPIRLRAPFIASGLHGINLKNIPDVLKQIAEISIIIIPAVRDSFFISGIIKIPFNYVWSYFA